MYQSHEFYLRRCIEISKDFRAHGNAPFGALLVDKDGNILMEQENIEITEKVCTGHAEATLAARTSHEYSKAFFVGLHPVHHRGAVRYVRRRHLLGEHRPRGIRHDGASLARAHRF